MATSEGLEPPTSKVEAWRSIQLSYEAVQKVSHAGYSYLGTGWLGVAQVRNLAIMVKRVGYDPTTNGLKGRYSTS
jgi:hypothetical protein